MKRLVEVLENPSGFDSMSNYLGEIPPNDLLVVLTRTRDADLLSESNWYAALDALGGESECVVIHRFGHWACGWWEALCVTAGTDSEKQGEQIVSRLADYPVLDEDDWSTREMDAANRAWKEDYSEGERIQYLRENEGAEFRSFSDLLSCVRGDYAPYTNSGYEGLIY